MRNRTWGILEIKLVKGAVVSSLSARGAFKLLEMLGSEGHFLDVPFFRITEFPDFELCQIFHNSLGSLINICSRPWWMRTWTLQEAVMSQHVMMNVESQSIGLGFFFKAASHYKKHQRECIGFGGCTLDMGDVPIMESLLLEQTLDNAIEKIIALPDYRKSETSLNVTATKHHIQSYRCFWILETARPLFNLRQGLASRANIWEIPPPGLDSPNPEGCGAHWEYQIPDLFAQDGVLPVEIIVIGKFSLTIPFHKAGDLNSPTGMVVQTLRSWHEAVIALQLPYANNFAFWRTICHGYAIDHKTGDEDDEAFDPTHAEIAEAWWEWLQEVPADMPLLKATAEYRKEYRRAGEMGLEQEHENLSHQIRALYCKTDEITDLFCTLDAERIGILPEDTATDDITAVDKGFENPMILRRVVADAGGSVSTCSCAEGTEQSPSQYDYVGYAYVDGILEGEAVMEDTFWEAVHLV